MLASSLLRGIIVELQKEVKASRKSEACPHFGQQVFRTPLIHADREVLFLSLSRWDRG
jgi:hypothetical protein